MAPRLKKREAVHSMGSNRPVAHCLHRENVSSDLYVTDAYQAERDRAGTPSVPG